MQTGTVTIAGGTGAQAVDIGTGGTGVKTISIGTGAIGNVISIGSVTGAASLTLNVGTGNFALVTAATSTITVGAEQTSGTMTLGGTAGTGLITIGASTGAQEVDIATGNAVKTVLVGNATAGGASVTTIHAGTGGLNLGTTADARTIAIGTGAAIQTVNLATGNVANVITMGDITGAPVGTVRLSGATVTVQGGLNFAVDAQASDTYVLTLAPALTGYVAGQMIAFTVATANTGAATINVNGLGAVALNKGADAALATNDLIVSRTYMAVYDGTAFDVINPATQ